MNRREDNCNCGDQNQPTAQHNAFRNRNPNQFNTNMASHQHPHQQPPDGYGNYNADPPGVQGTNNPDSGNEFEGEIPAYLKYLADFYKDELNEIDNISRTTSSMSSYIRKVKREQAEYQSRLKAQADCIDKFFEKRPYNMEVMDPQPPDSGCINPVFNHSQNITLSSDNPDNRNNMWEFVPELNDCRQLQNCMPKEKSIDYIGQPNPIRCPMPNKCVCDKIMKGYAGDTNAKCGDPKVLRCCDPCSNNDGMYRSPRDCPRCQFLHCKCGLCRQCRIYEYVLTIPNNVVYTPGLDPEELKRLKKKSPSKGRGSKRMSRDFKRRSQNERKNRSKSNSYPTGERQDQEVIGGPLITEYQDKYRLPPLPIRRSKVSKGKKNEESSGKPNKRKSREKEPRVEQPNPRPPWNESMKPDPKPDEHRISLDAAEAKLKELDRILGEEPEPEDTWKTKRPKNKKSWDPGNQGSLSEKTPKNDSEEGKNKNPKSKDKGATGNKTTTKETDNKQGAMTNKQEQKSLNYSQKVKGRKLSKSPDSKEPSKDQNSKNISKSPNAKKDKNNPESKKKSKDLKSKSPNTNKKQSKSPEPNSSSKKNSKNSQPKKNSKSPQPKKNSKSPRKKSVEKDQKSKNDKSKPKNKKSFSDDDDDDKVLVNKTTKQYQKSTKTTKVVPDQQGKNYNKNTLKGKLPQNSKKSGIEDEEDDEDDEEIENVLVNKTVKRMEISKYTKNAAKPTDVAGQKGKNDKNKPIKGKQNNKSGSDDDDKVLVSKITKKTTHKVTEISHGYTGDDDEDDDDDI